MSQKITSGFPQFREKDGSPLENGYVYVGTAGLSAPDNQITVYWDRALTIVAAQPIRTSGGFLMQDGAPSKIYSPVTDYSLSVQDKLTTEVYSNLNAGADDAVTGVTNLSSSQTSTTATVASDTGTDATIPQAIAGGNAGVISGADKAKLDSVETGATADQTDAEIEAAYNNQVSVVSQAQAADSTDTNVYRWTPQRVAQIAQPSGVNYGAYINEALTDAGKTAWSSSFIGTGINVTDNYSSATFNLRFTGAMTVRDSGRYLFIDGVIKKDDSGEPFVVLNGSIPTLSGSYAHGSASNQNTLSTADGLSTALCTLDFSYISGIGTAFGTGFEIERVHSGSDELCFRLNMNLWTSRTDVEFYFNMSGLRKYGGTEITLGEGTKF